MKCVQEKEIEIIEHISKSLSAKVLSCGLFGINAYTIEIEVDISGGVPNFVLVGLPDTAVNESKERVRAAIKSSNFEFPSKKIIVNLAPADTKKAGPTYDLPIAIGILAATNHVNKDNLENLFIVGELGLTGKIRSVNGVLPFILLAKKKGAKGIIIPEENSYEGTLIHGINIYPVSNLSQIINTVNNIEQTKTLDNRSTIHLESKHNLPDIDFSDVKGQAHAKRALEISACGGHHVLMIGPPGSGKSMLAQRLSTIFPPLSHEERIEVTQIYSVAGKLNKEIKLIQSPQFRSPHHTTSIAGLIGGGSYPTPGEISLAHKGVLFLDELTEFQKHALDSLRQAIEVKEVTISRSKNSCTFPCDFILIAACNPCPCGYIGDEIKKCTCSLTNIKKYQAKISGPILDRIDLQVEVKRLRNTELLSKSRCESSKEIKDRVLTGREFQKRRYKGKNNLTNSNLRPKEISYFCKLSNSTEKILKEAITKFILTGRSYDRILKVSRTIADLECKEIISDEHILEALQFRLNNLGSIK